MALAFDAASSSINLGSADATLADVRARFDAEASARWARARREIKRAIVAGDALGLGPTVPRLAQPTAIKAEMFRRWLGEQLQHYVIGTGDWLDAPLEAASSRSVGRSRSLWAHPRPDSGLPTGDAQQGFGFLQAGFAPPSQGVCKAATRGALAGVCDQVSDRAHAAVASGLLSQARAGAIARLLDEAFGYGLSRTRLLAEHAVTQAYSQATLDALEALGWTHVGTIAERHGAHDAIRDALPDDYIAGISREAGVGHDPEDIQAAVAKRQWEEHEIFRDPFGPRPLQEPEPSAGPSLTPRRLDVPGVARPKAWPRASGEPEHPPRGEPLDLPGPGELPKETDVARAGPQHFVTHDPAETERLMRAWTWETPGVLFKRVPAAEPEGRAPALGRLPEIPRVVQEALGIRLTREVAEAREDHRRWLSAAYRAKTEARPRVEADRVWQALQAATERLERVLALLERLGLGDAEPDDEPGYAGVMFFDLDGRALFLHRSDDNAWDLPGGMYCPPETAENGALREAIEELGGHYVQGELTEVARHPNGYVTFSTRVDEPFEPNLNEEHDDWGWFPVDDPPEPLREGLRWTLGRLRDEATDAGPEDEPRDPQGRWTTGKGGYEFVSPNVGSIGFDKARRALASHRERLMLEASADVDRAVGVSGTDGAVIGAWADGAEHSVMTAVDGADWDRLRLAAAMKGWLADQKQVLIFKEAGEGEQPTAALYSFAARGDLKEIHQHLLEDGVAFHTLQPTSDGARVWVVDTERLRETREIVATAASRYGGEINAKQGRAEFLGTTQETGTDREQRDDARRIYEGIIGGSPVQGGAAVWEGLHHRWGEALAQVRDALGWLFDANPHRHPKTGRFTTKIEALRERHREKRTGRFGRQLPREEVQARAERVEASFRKVTGRWDVLTAGDDRVCFPAFTMVRTSVGDKPIQHVRVGDEVLTRAGFKKVIETGQRQYAGRLLLVACGNAASFICTSDHPVWCERGGFVPADELIVGDILQLVADKLAAISSIVDLGLGDARDRPASVLQKLVPTFVRSAMPECAVDLQGDAVEREIDHVSTDLKLLDKGELQLFERSSDLRLDGSFARESAVAGEGAKSLLLRPRWRNALGLAAVEAGDCVRRAATVLGAKSPVQAACDVVRFVQEGLSAPLARFGDMSHVRSFAGDRAEVVAVRSSLVDGEASFALGALLDDFVVLRLFGAFARAVGTAFSRWGEIFVAMSAGAWPYLSLGGGRASDRAIAFGAAASGRLVSALELAAAALAAKNGHCTVYNLSVEGLPEFYANGVLVHNCAKCEKISADGPYTISRARSLIPAHPRCRCLFTPASAHMVSRDEEPWNDLIEDAWDDLMDGVVPGQGLAGAGVGVGAGAGAAEEGEGASAGFLGPLWSDLLDLDPEEPRDPGLP